uniref:Uncharacterized protein n=1 Tax=Meloidogyne javanica TaxID=6303 RepID=A0A915N5J7_MELJA
MENIEIRGNNEQQCLLEEEKKVEEVGEDKIVGELKEVGEEEEGKEEEKEEVDEKQNVSPTIEKTFSFATMGSGGQVCFVFKNIKQNKENENNNAINCCCCLQNQQQQCFVGNEQLLSAATLSKHEELLRQQQQKIAELQKELTRSQIGLQKHQQMLGEARKESQPRDPETGIIFGHVEYWLGQLINTHREQQLTLERQINGQKALVCAEQKLQEELHTEQAVQDISFKALSA